MLVPTRRAARSLRDAFAEALGGAALIPRIRALGDVDDEELTFEPGEDLLAPAISPLRRRLSARDVGAALGRRARRSLPFVQAMTHAGELAHFLDEAVTQGCDLSKLDTLAPDDLAAHWQDVLTFLRIVVEEWPKQLAAEGAIEPAKARDQRLRALASRAGGSAADGAGDRGGLHRLDPGDGGVAEGDCAASDRRGGASWPRHRSR